MAFVSQYTVFTFVAQCINFHHENFKFQFLSIISINSEFLVNTIIWLYYILNTFIIYS